MFATSPERAASRLVEQMESIERCARDAGALLELSAPSVSAWSIGQQFDHILKVVEFGSQALATLREPLPTRINLTGRVVLALGRFPRGVAQSPQRVLPQESVPADLAERAAALARRFSTRPLDAAIYSRDEPVFPHPVFGGLSARQGLRFLGIHTQHHLRIVDDIRRTAGAPEPKGPR